MPLYVVTKMAYSDHMASNLYHLLSYIPATESWEMPAALEALAQQLVRSGKLRINADTSRNFVRMGTADSDKTFTARELNDPKLRPATWKALARHVAPAEGEQGLQDLHARLQSDLKKAGGVSAEKEQRVARVLVQSAEPCVIQLLLSSGTEIFVSYSHNVGDLMPVHQWETEGTASGLQATADTGTAVYVSAGGDPFFEGEHKHYTTDGFPALARMVVIAGQELGHFSDLKRNAGGTIIGRYSTDAHHTRLRADPIAAAARHSDGTRVAALITQYGNYGLRSLRAAENAVAFYHKRRRYTPPWFLHQFRRLILWSIFIARCKRANIYLPLHVHPYHRLGEALESFLTDMAFNLAPDADVYRHPDPLVEEAIAVIEAVARVPQQVHKWGHEAVALAWPGLYRFYYGTVIPGCELALRDPLPHQKLPTLQRLTAKLRRRFRRPDYHPES